MARILIIDDDPAVSLTLSRMLELEGHEVKCVGTAQDGLAAAADDTPDAVILDIRIGHEENGWMILNLLTLDPATRPIPVIVCSAAVHFLQEHDELLQQYDCEVLPKPFDLDTLLHKVEAAVAKPRRG